MGSFVGKGYFWELNCFYAEHQLFYQAFKIYFQFF